MGSPRGDFEAHPAATDDWGVLSEADVVFLALKAYSLPGIAARLGNLLAPDAAVIAAQNGVPWWYFQSHGGALDGLTLEAVDPGGVIARSLPAASAVGCVVYCSAEIVEPGVIRHHEGTRFSLGEPDRSQSQRERALAAFRDGHLDVLVATDVAQASASTARADPVSLTLSRPRMSRVAMRVISWPTSKRRSVPAAAGVRSFSTSSPSRAITDGSRRNFERPDPFFVYAKLGMDWTL